MAKIGHKTGGVGGIRNDAAFIEFDNGYKAILTIYTHLSPLAVEAREAFIAQLAKDVLRENLAKHNVIFSASLRPSMA